MKKPDFVSRWNWHSWNTDIPWRS